MVNSESATEREGNESDDKESKDTESVGFIEGITWGLHILTTLKTHKAPVHKPKYIRFLSLLIISANKVNEKMALPKINN